MFANIRRAEQKEVPDRLAIKRAFHTLYRSGLNVTQAMAKIRAESSAEAVLDFCEFIEQSKRGICRFGGQAGHVVLDQVRTVDRERRVRRLGRRKPPGWPW